MKRITGSLCMALLLVATSSASPAQEVRTTICELAGHGKPLSGQRVRLTVIYMSDQLERSLLLDRRCPKVRLAPYNSIETPDPSVGRFDEALRGRLGELALRQFVVDISGRFTWHGHDEPYGSLEIQKVWSFRRIYGNWRKRSKPRS